MFFLNRKLRIIEEEIQFLEIAIDEVDIYDLSGKYADILKDDYTQRLFKLLAEKHELKKNIVLRNAILSYLALIVLFAILMFYKK
jgi:hypothetical protein